jgi:transposase-like protein
VRLRVEIPRVKPGRMKRPEVCPKEGCKGKHFKPHQKNCDKPLQDTEYDRVNVERWNCLRCGETFRVYPAGVSGAQRSDRLKGANVLLYVLGLSYGGVGDFMSGLGYPVGKTTVYRDVQATGEKVRELRQAWLRGQAGKVRIVGGDPTHVRCGGEDVIVGVTVNAETGMTLDICILDNEQAESLTDWLQPMLELVGARVLITDDADGLKTAADQAGVHHQVCRQHVTPNLLAFIAKAADKVLKTPPPVPQGLEISVDQFLEDLMLLEWIMLGHPGHGDKLLEQLYMRYAAAPAPKKGRRASIWYRMRNHILHLWDNWRRLTCYRTLKHTEGLEVDETNNCSERAIGWNVKERYRTMRGYKRKRSILNVTGLTAWLRDQPPGYDMSPLFTS